MIRNFSLIVVLTCILALPAQLAAESVKNNKSSQKNISSKGPVDPKIFDKSQFKDAPTEITSDSLSLDSKERVFRYSGHVKVVHGDMILTSDELEGIYNEQNKIDKLIAKKNVTILKGDNIKATGGRAEYYASAEVMTLSESPEIEQNGSALTADTIKLFMNDNRSEAIGQVRVKVANVQDSNSVLGKK